MCALHLWSFIRNMNILRKKKEANIFHTACKIKNALYCVHEYTQKVFYITWWIYVSCAICVLNLQILKEQKKANTSTQIIKYTEVKIYYATRRFTSLNTILAVRNKDQYKNEENARLYASKYYLGISCIKIEPQCF